MRMKIFTTEQIRAWDVFTIEREPVASVELMNRAARAFTEWFVRLYPDTEQAVYILAGTGNNGGDGIAVARLLHQRFYPVKVVVCAFGGKHSADFEAQIRLLPAHAALEVVWLDRASVQPEVPDKAVLIDALFGTGLTRPLEGPWLPFIEWVNQLPHDVVAIDVPSGAPPVPPREQDLPAEAWPGVRATRTFSFEIPKLMFFFPEYAGRVGEWAFGAIGLHPDFARDTETPYEYLTKTDVKSLLKPRGRFAHKGTFGHALLINGSTGKMGAAVLAARACLRSGAGLLTVHIPEAGLNILQTAVPEAMCSPDPERQWSSTPALEPYSAIGVGCGIGTGKWTTAALEKLLQEAWIPLVLDADALNLLARHPKWLPHLPKNSILTPHPKEFERLFGVCATSWERHALQRAKARELGVFIVLKGANTAIAAPDGSCWFNSTGNPGMATGGSGDVLTGVITGLLAQGYSARDACLLGVYLHGLAGDLAAARWSQPGMTAGDIVEHLGQAWLALEG